MTVYSYLLSAFIHISLTAKTGLPIGCPVFAVIMSFCQLTVMFSNPTALLFSAELIFRFTFPVILVLVS